MSPRPTGVDALRREIVDQLNDPEADWLKEPESSPRLDRLKERAAGGDPTLTLEELAAVCRDCLAWDSWSFLNELGVEHDDDIRAEPTDDGWRQLTELNGDKPFTFPLDNWST